MKLITDKILGIILVLVLLGLIFEGMFLYNYYNLPAILGLGVDKKKESSVDKIEDSKEIILPKSLDLKVPFIPQAPFGDWSYPFSHNCEEAAVLMVDYFLRGKKIVDLTQARKELLDLVEYQTRKYGFHEDSSTAETAKLIEDYYGYKVRVKYDITLRDIKKQLAQGNPVIVPSAGRMLNNPNFTPPGPLYHMLVIKGYNETGFITNDPGTWRGADYFYSYQTLMNSIHDWGNDNVDIEEGRSAIIFIEK